MQPAPQRATTREMLGRAVEVQKSLGMGMQVGLFVLNFGVNFLLWHFEVAAIAPYAANGKLISLHPKPDEGSLPGTCSSEWHRLHQLLLVTLASFVVSTLCTTYTCVKNAKTPEQMQAIQNSCIWKVLNAPMCP